MPLSISKSVPCAAPFVLCTKEDLAVKRIEIARDGTISVITAPRPKLDLTNEIESLGLDETRAHGAAP
jgi:hypothetical protein